MDLSTLNPTDFQQLAVALLQAEARVRVVPVGLAFGRNDQGYDGRVEAGNVGALTAPLRVEVKRTSDFGTLKTALERYLDRYHDLPVVLLTSCKLSIPERDALVVLARERGVVLEVRDHAELVQIGMNHPWLSRWFLERGAGALRPVVDGPPDGQPRGRLMPVEAAARDTILARLAQGDAPFLAVYGGPRVRPGLVIHAAAEALGRGAWVVEEAGPRLARRVWQELGAGRDTALLLAGDQALALCKSPDLQDVPILAVVSAADAAAWGRRARPNGRRVEMLEVARPTLEEIRRWAQDLGSRDAWRDALLRTRPELVEGALAAADDVAVVGQALLDQRESGALTAAGLRAVFGVVCLSPVDTLAVARMVGGSAQVDPDRLAAWIPGADPDAAAGLLERGADGRLGVVSPLEGLAALWAMGLEDRAWVVERLAALLRLDDEAGCRALRWWVDGPAQIVGGEASVAGWEEVVADVLDALSEEERFKVALRDGGKPPLLSVAERHAAWFTGRVEAGLAAEDPFFLRVAAVVLPRAVAAARRWPAVAVRAVGVLAKGVTLDLESLRTEQQVDAAVAELVAPGKVAPGAAADVLEALTAALAKESTPGLARLAGGAVKPWMTWGYKLGRLEGTTWVVEHYPIPAGGPAWGRAHAATRALLTSLLRDATPWGLVQGLRALEAAEHVADSYVTAQVEAGLAVVKERLAASPSPAARVRINRMLEELAHRRLPVALRIRGLEAWRSDDALSLIRHVLGSGAFPDDMKAAMEALKTDPPAAFDAIRPWAQIKQLRRDRVKRWVNDIPKETRDAAVRNLFAEAAAALAWMGAAREPSSPDAAVLVDLANSVPGPFREVLTGTAWEATPMALRPLLAGVLTTAFREELREAVATHSGAGGFIGRLLQFVARPDRFSDEDGSMWVDVLERISLSSAVPAHVIRLARLPSDRLRLRLADWWRHHLSTEAVDPRDGERTTETLVGDGGWGVLDRIVGRELIADLARRHPWFRQQAVRLALRYFGGLNQPGALLRPDLTTEGQVWAWVAEDLPADWWCLRQVVSGLLGEPGDPAIEHPVRLMDQFPVGIASGLLVWRPNPPGLDPENRYGVCTAFDHVVNRLPDDEVEARIGGLPPDAPLRLALLIRAVTENTFAALEESLAAIGADEADLVAWAVGGAGGTSGTRFSRAKVLRGFEDDDLFDPHPLRPHAEELDRRAEARGGRVGEQLRAIAALARGVNDDPALLAVVERCKRHLQERADARPG